MAITINYGIFIVARLESSFQVARLESSSQAVRIHLDGGSLFSAAQVSQLLKAITADMQDIPS